MAKASRFTILSQFPAQTKNGNVYSIALTVPANPGGVSGYVNLPSGVFIPRVYIIVDGEATNAGYYQNNVTNLVVWTETDFTQHRLYVSARREFPYSYSQTIRVVINCSGMA